jgi:hypothetical protein
MAPYTEEFYRKFVFISRFSRRLLTLVNREWIEGNHDVKLCYKGVYCSDMRRRSMEAEHTSIH